MQQAQPRQKNTSNYTDSLLRLLFNSFALLVAFTLAQMYFTANDWMDSSYFTHKEWLLKDIGKTMAFTGIAGGLYIGAQVWLAVRFTKGKSKMIRYSTVAVLLVISMAFTMSAITSSLDSIVGQARTVVGQR